MSPYDLNKIKGMLNEIADAIKSVIALELTIVDQNLNRIIATGKYKKEVGMKIHEDSVFSYALNYGKSFIINEPREHEACKICSKRDKCSEYAEICSPIVVEDEIVGVIGLIAFDQEQKEYIKADGKNILNFLNKMSTLIASKLSEEKYKVDLLKQSRELEFLLNSLDDAVISIDQQGNILNFNQPAEAIVKAIEPSLNIFEAYDFKREDVLVHYISTNNAIVMNGKRYIYTVKPLLAQGEIVELLLIINEVKTFINTINEMITDNTYTTFDDILGNSKAITNAKNNARKFSKSTSTILIQGESGTGKELFARAIHYESNRKNKPFIAINCAAIPEKLLESELFGYTEGSFTGAKKGGKIGKFELAKSGTIFLDEIGELPLHLQSKLLRVIQENKITRIGGIKVIDIDVRIIAATNRDLETMVEHKEFREDLYYRLNVIPLKIPSLNERIEDIEVLSEYFLDKYSEKLNKKVDQISLDVIEVFKQRKWKGNIRELENLIEYCINITETHEIKLQDLPKKLESQSTEQQQKVYSIETLEKNEIKKAIKLYGNTVKGYQKAYQALGISRATFYRKLKKYELK